QPSSTPGQRQYLLLLFQYRWSFSGLCRSTGAERRGPGGVRPLMENDDGCCCCGVAELGATLSVYWSFGSATAAPEPPTLTGSWVKANAGTATPRKATAMTAAR